MAMPIRAELRHHYGRVWRTVVRPRILARAGNRCEECGKPNGKKVETITAAVASSRVMWWRTRKTPRWWHSPQTALEPWQLLGRRGSPPPRKICVVLTVAHLNHVPGDDRDENLRALCQWCHLHYDRAHHAETRATRKDRARPLLAEATA
jgi:hypothetical protein